MRNRGGREKTEEKDEERTVAGAEEDGLGAERLILLNERLKRHRLPMRVEHDNDSSC